MIKAQYKIKRDNLEAFTQQVLKHEGKLECNHEYVTVDVEFENELKYLDFIMERRPNAK